MKKILLLIALTLLAISTTSALEPLKVAIFKTGGAANVQVVLNDYTGGTATAIYTGPAVSLTPNSSGVIIINIANNTAATDWADITAAQVNSHYILDVLVGGTLYAQYRLDQQIINQSQGGVLDNSGNFTPTENGAGSVGTDDNRWDGLYVTGNTLHVGPVDGELNNDELAFSYNDATNTATMTVAGTTALTATAINIELPGTITINGKKLSSGSSSVAFGKDNGTLLDSETSIGYRAGNNNLGDHLTSLGAFSGFNNSGEDVVPIGYWSGTGNEGNNVISLGTNSAFGNEGNNVISFGKDSGKFNKMSNVTIFSNDILPEYANRTAATTAITTGNGAKSGNTYMYYNTATNSIEAVRLP